MNLFEKLSSIITTQVADFEIDATDFQMRGDLSEADKEFLAVHKPVVLCFLQHLLLRHASPDSLVPDVEFIDCEPFVVFRNNESFLEMPFDDFRVLVAQWFSECLENELKLYENSGI